MKRPADAKGAPVIFRLEGAAGGPRAGRRSRGEQQTGGECTMGGERAWSWGSGAELMDEGGRHVWCGVAWHGLPPSPCVNGSLTTGGTYTPFQGTVQEAKQGAKRRRRPA